MKQKPLIIATIAIVVVLGFIFWYWQSKKSTPVVTVPTSAVTSTGTSLGAQVFEKAQNPINGKLPETNPFKAKTNPFTGVETNPLKAGTVNPFP